jgi:hypothetical protein
MCSSKPKPVEPAAAPAPPLPPPEVPAVGETRRQETREVFGDDVPNYRVRRTSKKNRVNPSSPIQM